MAVTPQATITGTAATATSAVREVVEVTTSTSWTPSVGEKILASVYSFPDTPDHNAPTASGVSWTLVREQVDADLQAKLSTWIGTVNTSTTGTVTGNFSSDGCYTATIIATRFSGTSGVGASAGAGSPVGNSSTPSVAITTTTVDALVYGAISARTRTFTKEAADTTLSLNLTINSPQSGSEIKSNAIYRTAPVTTPGSMTLAGTLNGTQDWSFIAVELLPSTGGQTYDETGGLATLYSFEGGTATFNMAPDQNLALLGAFEGGTGVLVQVETSGSVQAIVEALSTVLTLTLVSLGPVHPIPVPTTGTDTATFALEGTVALLVSIEGGTDFFEGGAQTYDELTGFNVIYVKSLATSTQQMEEMDGETVVGSFEGAVSTFSMLDVGLVSTLHSFESGTDIQIQVELGLVMQVPVVTQAVGVFNMNATGNPAIIYVRTTGIDLSGTFDFANPQVIHVSTSSSVGGLIQSDLLNSLALILVSTLGVDGGQNDEVFGSVVVAVVLGGLDERELRRLGLYPRSALVALQPYRGSGLQPESLYTRSALHDEQPYRQSTLASG